MLEAVCSACCAVQQAAKRRCTPSPLELAANDDVLGFQAVISADPKLLSEPASWYGRQTGGTAMVHDQQTPVMIAALYGSVNVLRFILSLGVEGEGEAVGESEGESALLAPSTTASGSDAGSDDISRQGLAKLSAEQLVTQGPVDINLCVGGHGITALHCAAAGGSSRAVEAVALLLGAGAKWDVVDRLGRRPLDVIMVPPKLSSLRSTLERLLAPGSNFPSSAGFENGYPTPPPASVVAAPDSPSSHDTMDSTQDDEGSKGGKEASNEVSVKASESQSRVVQSGSALSSSSADGGDAVSSTTSPPPLSDAASVMSSGSSGSPPAAPTKEERFGVPDPTMPDIKSHSLYASDDFRMYKFKVQPCSRAYSHDWTECPFVHPGENARRRDPRRFHYSCVPCPDFRKGSCRRGDACEYAHGVFECWLHPAQYRTRLCKDGIGCARRVCFFAHAPDELRPVYPATGSGLPPVTSPRSTSPVNGRESSPPPAAPPSPQSVLLLAGPSYYSPAPSPGPQGNFASSTPPLSPSSGAPGAAPLPLGWSTSAPQSVPTLQLPNGSQASRLRAVLHARDLQALTKAEQEAMVARMAAAEAAGKCFSMSASAPEVSGSAGLAQLYAEYGGTSAQVSAEDFDFYGDSAAGGRQVQGQAAPWNGQAPARGRPGAMGAGATAGTAGGGRAGPGGGGAGLLMRARSISDADNSIPAQLSPSLSVLRDRRNSYSGRDRYAMAAAAAALSRMQADGLGLGGGLPPSGARSSMAGLGEAGGYDLPWASSIGGPDWARGPSDFQGMLERQMRKTATFSGAGVADIAAAAVAAAGGGSGTGSLNSTMDEPDTSWVQRLVRENSGESQSPHQQQQQQQQQHQAGPHASDAALQARLDDRLERAYWGGASRGGAQDHVNRSHAFPASGANDNLWMLMMDGRPQNVM